MKYWWYFRKVIGFLCFFRFLRAFFILFDTFLYFLGVNSRARPGAGRDAGRVAWGISIGASCCCRRHGFETYSNTPGRHIKINKYRTGGINSEGMRICWVLVIPSAMLWTGMGVGSLDFSFCGWRGQGVLVICTLEKKVIGRFTLDVVWGLGRSWMSGAFQYRGWWEIKIGNR